MKKIMGVVERGEWRRYPTICKMTLEQIENMKKTILEFETLGIKEEIKQRKEYN